MKVLGVLVNVLAIIVAGGVGVLFRGKLKVRYQEMMVQACGLAAILVGFFSAWDSFFVIQEGQLETEGTILVVASLLLGGLIGAALDVERGLDRLGGFFCRLVEKDEQQEALRLIKKQRERAAKRAVAEAKGQKLPRSLNELPVYEMPSTRSGKLFNDGFVLATVITAFSSMGLRASLENGLDADPVPLFIKSAVDAAFVLLLVTVYGTGVTFAAIPVLVTEGTAVLCSVFWSEHLTAALTDQICLVAALMTVAVGIQMAFAKKLKVANLAPALLIPVFYRLIMSTVENLIDKE